MRSGQGRGLRGRSGGGEVIAGGQDDPSRHMLLYLMPIVLNQYDLSSCQTRRQNTNTDQQPSSQTKRKNQTNSTIFRITKFISVESFRILNSCFFEIIALYSHFLFRASCHTKSHLPSSFPISYCPFSV